MTGNKPRREWSNPDDPWNPCVILGVSLNPTLSEVEDAFAPLAASDQNLVVDRDTQTAEEFEKAYERRKKQDAYVYLKCCLRLKKPTAPKAEPSESTTPKVELEGGDDDITSKKSSPTSPPNTDSQATPSSTYIPTSLTDPSRFSISSVVTTATTTVADAGYTTRNSSAQTFKYQSDPEGSRRRSKFHIGKPRRRRPKLRGTRSTTGSSSSMGSQFSDASTDGARETLAAISDILQEHTKSLGSSGDGTAKGQSLLRGVFTSLRRSHSGSRTSDENISQPLAGLVLRFQQVESVLDRSDTDPYDLHRRLVILYDDLSRDLKKEMKQNRGGWNSASQSQFQQMIKGYEKRVAALTKRPYPPSALGNRLKGGRLPK
ncbi:hypothetical protein FALCPG4_008709 [Fusarium falciforme]